MRFIQSIQYRWSKHPSVKKIKTLKQIVYKLENNNNKQQDFTYIDRGPGWSRAGPTPDAIRALTIFGPSKNLLQCVEMFLVFFHANSFAFTRTTVGVDYEILLKAVVLSTLRLVTGMIAIRIKL